MAWGKDDNPGPWGRPHGGGGKGGGPGGGFGGEKKPRAPEPPDFDELLRRGGDRVRRFLPGGGDGGKGFVLFFTAFILLWVSSGVYFVKADEQGVIMRFGRYHRTTPPGIGYHLPWPVETVTMPKVTAVNRVEIGFRSGYTRGGRGDSSIAEESLMLTGDENIVDINFVVYWRIKPEDVQSYLFNIQNPEVTVKEVAQSAMREVVGQNNIQPILTEARQKTEQAVHKLMQDVLDFYKAGIRVDQVRLQKVDPPTQVIDAFRDVQGARADQERLQNEAYTYANRVVPEARGEAERILQAARAYKEQTVAEATGQTARFLKVYEEYKKAPEVTRRRMYLETMERVLGGADKIIIDSRGGQGVVPFISLGRKKE